MEQIETKETRNEVATQIAHENREIRPAPKEKRVFVIVNGDNSESGTYTSHSPRQAAMKAIKTLAGTKEKPVEFKLRARGNHSQIHVFSGYTERTKTPESMKAFIKSDTIKSAHVEKIRVERVK